jgi:hypothetical protein
LLLLAVISAALLSACGDIDGKSPPPQHVSLGERISLGHIVYVAYETQWLTQLGEGADARIPQNRFFLVRVSAVNSGSSPVTVPNFSLVDDSGNTYQEINDETRAVPQYIGFLRRVGPAESAQGHALFDVAPRHYQLRVTDEDGERAALIDIPLSFTSQSPDVPEVGDGKKNQPTPILPKR